MRLTQETARTPSVEWISACALTTLCYVARVLSRNMFGGGGGGTPIWGFGPPPPPPPPSRLNPA